MKPQVIELDFYCEKCDSVETNKFGSGDIFNILTDSMTDEHFENFLLELVELFYNQKIDTIYKREQFKEMLKKINY